MRNFSAIAKTIVATPTYSSQCLGYVCKNMLNVLTAVYDNLDLSDQARREADEIVADPCGIWFKPDDAKSLTLNESKVIAGVSKLLYEFGPKSATFVVVNMNTGRALVIFRNRIH